MLCMQSTVFKLLETVSTNGKHTGLNGKLMTKEHFVGILVFCKTFIKMEKHKNKL